MNGYGSGFAEIKSLQSEATLRVSLFGGTAAPSAVLLATYRRSDPLVVVLDITDPRGDVLFRRTVLRADIALGLDAPVAHAGVQLRPADSQMVEVAFVDNGAAVAVRIPDAAARRFLALTYRIVQVDDEGAVLGELAAQIALDRG